MDLARVGRVYEAGASLRPLVAAVVALRAEGAPVAPEKVWHALEAVGALPVVWAAFKRATRGGGLVALVTAVGKAVAAEGQRDAWPVAALPLVAATDGVTIRGSHGGLGHGRGPRTAHGRGLIASVFAVGRERAIAHEAVDDTVVGTSALPKTRRARVATPRRASPLARREP